MKVIARANQSTYICSVSHDELEKFMGMYYGKLERLEVGEELNLGLGYDFATRIESACKNMAVAMSSFDDAKKSMTGYAIAISKHGMEAEQVEAA